MSNQVCSSGFRTLFSKNNSVGSIIVVEMGGEFRAACCIFSDMFGCDSMDYIVYIGICIVVDAAGMCVGSVQCRLFPSE